MHPQGLLIGDHAKRSSQCRTPRAPSPPIFVSILLLLVLATNEAAAEELSCSTDASYAGLGVGCPCSPGSPCAEGLHCTGQFNDVMLLKSDMNSSQVNNYQGGFCMPCTEGDFCPYGTTLVRGLIPDAEVDIGARQETHRLEMTKSLLCPEGFYCPTPSQILECPEGWYCPLGSVRQTSCWLPQLFLKNPAVSVVQISDETIFDRLRSGSQLIEGNICPAGSSDPSRMCPPGYYCPTPDTAYTCPEGTYCPEGSTSPIGCPWLSSCPAGSTKASISWAGPIIGAIIALALGCCIGVGMWVERRRMAANRHYACKQERFAEIMALAGLPKPELGAFEDIDVKLSITFKELTLTLKNGSTILNGITGTFQHSNLIAIMGGSGCGKSSFLNVLCGKATYGKTTGHVLLNGERTPLSTLRSVKGFVPQDDTVHEDLTVQENLAYSAAVRLPRSYTQAKRAQLVHATCDLLQLTPVMNSVVGSVEARGISGGQRKRVNIGVELVSSPSVLFLDEPTSGLDSTMALSVLSGLKQLCQRGLTSIMVIHQPRPSIFKLFDQVLLLGFGGSQVYLGPSSLTLPYFAHIGFVQPRNENLSDFLLDVIQGHVECKNDCDFDLEQLCALWKEGGEAWVRSPGLLDTGSRGVSPAQSYDDLTAMNYTSKNIPRLKRGLNEKFDEIDTDGDGFITDKEMRKFVRSMGHACKTEDAGMIIQAMSDGRSQETLSKSEFVKYGVRGGGAFAELIGGRTRQQLMSRSLATVSSQPFQQPPSPLASGGMLHPPAFPMPFGMQAMSCNSPPLSNSQSGNLQHSLPAASTGHAQHLSSPPLSNSPSENLQHSLPPVSTGHTQHLSNSAPGSPYGLGNFSLQQQQSPVAMPPATNLLYTGQLEAPPSPASSAQGQHQRMLEMMIGHGMSSQSCSRPSSPVPMSPSPSTSVRGLSRKNTSALTRKNSMAAPPKERDILDPVRQCWVVFKRCAIKWIRAWNLRIMDLALTTGLAAVIGSLQGTTWSLGKVGVNLLLCTLSMGIIVTSASLPVFGRDAVLRWREVASGFSAFSIFLGTATFDLLDVTVRPLLFSAVYWSLTATDIPFSYFLLVSWLISWWCSGLGYLLSVTLGREIRVLAGACVPIVLAGFLSGLSPTLQSMGALSPLHLVTYLSYARWAIEALVISYFSNVDLQFRIQALALLDSVGYCGFVFREESAITIGRLPKVLAVLKELGVTNLPGFDSALSLLLSGFFPGIYDGQLRNATGILTAFEVQCSGMGESVGTTICGELRRVYDTAVGYNRCSEASYVACCLHDDQPCFGYGHDASMTVTARVE